MQNGLQLCAKGSMGFKGNLSSGKILEQLVHASRIAAIRNVIFMGMGELLNNYSTVVEAIRVMTATPFQSSPKKITLTGRCHQRYQQASPRYTKLKPSCVPACTSSRNSLSDNACSKSFTLERLTNALRDYQATSHQKIFIEYIMLDGVNDESSTPTSLVVNLIPFNPMGCLSHYQTTNDQKISEFQIILRGTYNIRTSVCKQMGQDICGQLVVNLPGKGSSRSADLITDIEDLRI